MITTLLAAALLAPSPTEAHPVVVGETRLSRGHLRHWADVVQRSSADGRRPARRQAARLLISFHWVLGETHERGIVVTGEEVTRNLRDLRDQTFPSRRDYRAFLRDSGQTAHDMRFRARLDLLSNALRELATAGVPPEQQEDALEAFVVAFRAKWRARTACREPWISEGDCGTTSPGRTRRSPARGRRASRGDGGLGWGRLPSKTPFRPTAPAS